MTVLRMEPRRLTFTLPGQFLPRLVNKIGPELLAIKEALPHGEIGPWP